MRIKSVKYSKQRGVALILTLWLIVLLTVIGGSHARNVRLDTQLTTNHLAKTQARMLAEAGLSRAILELFVTDPELRWMFDGTEYRVKLESGEVSIRIQNAAGLIDLNSAPHQLLSELFKAVGLEDRAAAELVAAILDWRDADDLIRINGAEDLEYKLANLDYGTPDSKFRSLEELRYVLGMTREIYARIRPYLTIYSRLGGINVNYMPAELKDLLIGAAADGASPLIDEDAERNEVATVVAGVDLVGRLSDAFHISVRATHAGKAVAELSVVVDVGKQRGQLYMLRRWDETTRAIEVKDV